MLQCVGDYGFGVPYTWPPRLTAVSAVEFTQTVEKFGGDSVQAADREMSFEESSSSSSFTSVRDHSLAVGGQRETSVEFARTPCGFLVSERTRKRHAEDDVEQVMTMMRTGVRAVVGWVGGEEADEFRMSTAKTPCLPNRSRPDYEQEESFLTSQSLHVSRAGPQSRHRVQHQFTFLVTVWTTMRPPCVVNRATNQL